MFLSIKKIAIILLAIWIIQPGHLIAATKKTTTHKVSSAVKSSKKIIKPAQKKSKKIVAQKKLKLKPKPRPIHRPIRTAQQIVKPASTVVSKNIHSSSIPAYLLTSVEKNLVGFVRNSIESIRYTAYKLGGSKIDPSHGIYIVDCSRYVDHILKYMYPRAYSSLTTWSGTEKPTTDDYYQYFRNLSEDSRYWNTITDVEDLRPGDILVFRTKNRYGIETSGHIMIVMDKPERNGNIFLVRIADSAPSGHSEDTRRAHASGIGIGNMLLKVNPQTSLPYAYAWKVGSRWETNVSFAMARPVDFA